VQKSTKVCVRRHRGVHRGTERVCATMPEERRRPEFFAVSERTDSEVDKIVRDR